MCTVSSAPEPFRACASRLQGWPRPAPAARLGVGGVCSLFSPSPHTRPSPETSCPTLSVHLIFFKELFPSIQLPAFMCRSFPHQRVLNEWSWPVSSILGPCFVVVLSLSRSLWVSQPASPLLVSLSSKPIRSFNSRPPSPCSLLQSLESFLVIMVQVQNPGQDPQGFPSRPQPGFWHVILPYCEGSATPGLRPALSPRPAATPSLLPDDIPVTQATCPLPWETNISPSDCAQPLFPSHLPLL